MSIEIGAMMKNRAESLPNPDASPETSAATADPAAETKTPLEPLRRSIRATKLLVRAIDDCRRSLNRLSAPFLERGKEQDSQKKISARKERQRSAVFLTAKDLLNPDHPARKFVEESHNSSHDLDPSISLHAQEVKSTILEPLTAIIDQALKDADTQKSPELVEQFTAAIQNLIGEMDRRVAEIRQLRKKFQGEFWHIWIDRLITTRNIVAAAALICVVAVGAIGYAMKARGNAKSAGVATPAIEKTPSPARIAAPALPETTSSAASKIAPAAAAGPVQPPLNPAQPNATDSKPLANSSPNTDPISKSGSGDLTLKSGQDPESMKKSMRALGEIIRAWNAQDEATAAREKTRKK